MSENPKRKDSGGDMMMGGIIMVGIGLVFLLSNLGILPEIGDLWPAFIIVVGIALIVNAMSKKKKSSDQ